MTTVENGEQGRRHRRGASVSLSLIAARLRKTQPPLQGSSGIGWPTAVWLAFSYILLYALGYLLNPVTASCAIWPADALTFAAYVLLPYRRWPLAALGMILSEMIAAPLLNWMGSQPQVSLTTALGFSVANILTTAGPASLARILRLSSGQERLRLAMSPVWIIALFAGVLPGAILGAATRAHASGMALVTADVGLWTVASVLTIVTFGPTVFGVLRGFSEPVRAPARPWEGWAVSAVVTALFIWFALMPWPVFDQQVEPMLFAVPLAWLALRFSRRATSVAVVIIALGVVLLAEHTTGVSPHLANVESWREVIISVDIFLLIGCGGALLVNLTIVQQRALHDDLWRKHSQLRRYAHALDLAEEAARRATAADLHDGVGQVLAGQSMTLAAMRRHASHPLLAALLEEAAAAAREAQEGLRVMIQTLSPPEVAYASLDDMLRWLAYLFETRFEFRVTCRVTGTGDLHRDQLHLVYRCIRELVMNARKHSQRQSAEVDVIVSLSSVEIMVIDEGVGFDARRTIPIAEHRFGLAQLRDRVSSAGGTLHIDTVVGEGCRVKVRLPSLVPAP